MNWKIGLIFPVLVLSLVSPSWSQRGSGRERQSRKPVTARKEMTKADMAQEDLKYYQELFKSVIGECPLDGQQEMMDLIRSLSAATNMKSPKGKKYLRPREELLEDVEAGYEALLGEFPPLEATIAGAQASWSEKPKRLSVALGLGRHVLLQVANAESAPIRLRVPPRGKPVVVPPGEARALLLKILIDASEASEASLSFEVNGKEVALELPIDVVEPATLKGTILDSDLGKPFPGRLWVKCSDGARRHGKAYADIKTVSQKPLLTPNGVNYKLPFFYSDGEFEIVVPPGKTEVTLERGFEHEIVTETYDLKAGETKTVEIASGRIIDMKKLGWISGDTHVHWAKNWWNEDESLDLLYVVQRAEDVRVVNNLTLRHHNPPQKEFIAPTQRPMGPIEDYSDGEYHIEMGEEYRNAPFYGHVNYINIKSLIQPISTGDIMGKEALDYPTNYSRHLMVKEQGGLVIQAHGMAPQAPADLALGVNDSLDQLDPGGYYRILDCGFRQPLSNGSDHPARIVGCARAYVKTEGPFTYEGWIKGIQKKQTFTTSGPLLFLTVNGKDIGEEVRLKKGETMKIKVKAVSRKPIGKLQVVANHENLIDVEVAETQREVEIEVPVEKSCWVVARCARGKSLNAIQAPDVAHTSAIYVVVDGERIFVPEAAEKFAQQMRGHAINLAKKGNFENDEQREEAAGVFTKAAEAYDAMLGVSATKEKPSQGEKR